MDVEAARLVIDLRCGDGPMTGNLLAEGQNAPTAFSGWVELVALLEAARRPATPGTIETGSGERQ